MPRFEHWSHGNCRSHLRWPEMKKRVSTGRIQLQQRTNSTIVASRRLQLHHGQSGQLAKVELRSKLQWKRLGFRLLRTALAIKVPDGAVATGSVSVARDILLFV